MREEAALQFQQDLKALHEVSITLAAVESVDALLPPGRRARAGAARI